MGPFFLLCYELKSCRGNAEFKQKTNHQTLRHLYACRRSATSTKAKRELLFRPNGSIGVDRWHVSSDDHNCTGNCFPQSSLTFYGYRVHHESQNYHQEHFNLSLLLSCALFFSLVLGDILRVFWVLLFIKLCLTSTPIQ